MLKLKLQYFGHLMGRAYRINLVDGLKYNIKITTPEDLEIAKLWLD